MSVTKNSRIRHGLVIKYLVTATGLISSLALLLSQTDGVERLMVAYFGLLIDVVDWLA